MLAGHSFGGLYVQTFAANYPDQVVGLVLLDSTAPKPGLNLGELVALSDNLYGNQCANPAGALNQIVNRMAFLGFLCHNPGWDKPTACCGVSERRSSLCGQLRLRDGFCD